MLASESTFWVCLGKCAQWLLEIQDSRNRLSEWGVTECQLDELWSFVRKKEAHLTLAEKVLALYGDAWVWIAFAPAWRLAAAFVVGKRDQDNANVLLERLHAVSCGYIPFFTSNWLRVLQMLLTSYII
jgi:IS1 family transposase